jgi:hypothetical protein
MKKVRTLFKQTSECSENEYRTFLKLSFSQHTANFLLAENFLQMLELELNFRNMEKCWLLLEMEKTNYPKMQHKFFTETICSEEKVKDKFRKNGNWCEN